MSYYKNTKSKSRAFTIVELLIVVVVIGVLAAITFISYGAISQKATVAMLQSDLSNATKKLKVFQVVNNVFPTTIDCSQADSSTNQCVKSSGDVSYQYSVNNSTSPATFCITATSGSISYRIENNSAPVVGGCPGHGVGGAAPITNLATNPSFEAGVSTGVLINTTIASTESILSDSSKYESRVLRRTISTTATANAFGAYTQLSGMVSSSQYSLSAWVRSNRSINFYVQAEERDSNGALITTVTSTPVALAANNWTKLSLTYTLAAGGAKTTFCIYSLSTAWAAGDTVDFDGFMATQGDTVYNFADGNSANWVWNGAANLSTSTGPVL